MFKLFLNLGWGRTTYYAQKTTTLCICVSQLSAEAWASEILTSGFAVF